MGSIIEEALTPRIKLLDPDVASKIAAGEVVERPASVLKEILENSLDAGATKIDVAVVQGGIESITVIDNGCGIVQHDLQLALQQHATSKIDNEGDLARITSLGFRGEALASINSVAKLHVVSHTAQQDHAWSISGTQINPAAHPVGTTIKMQDLFYNVPARRKFLRSSRTEYIYLEDVFRRIALSHFNVAFTLKHNDKLVKNLPVCKDQAAMLRRLSTLCGKQLTQTAISIDAEQNGLRIWGWLGTVDSARSQEPHQYFFINKRVIKDRLINHAIRQVYQPLCMDGKMPFYCLYLELDPVALDVNVHPTKHEVRFRDARIIHAFLTQILNAALTQQTAVVSPAPQNTQQNFAGNFTFAKNATDAPLIEVLCILEGKIILARVQQEVVVIDIQSAQQALLQQALNADHAANRLEVPIAVNMQIDFEVNNEFAQWCRAVGIEIAQLGPSKVVIRSLPQALLRHKLDFAELLNKLYTLWKQQATKEQALLVLVQNTKFTAISQLEVETFVSQVLKLATNNIYRIMNADMLQAILHSSS